MANKSAMIAVVFACAFAAHSVVAQTAPAAGTAGAEASGLAVGGVAPPVVALVGAAALVIVAGGKANSTTTATTR